MTRKTKNPQVPWQVNFKVAGNQLMTWMGETLKQQLEGPCRGMSTFSIGDYKAKSVQKIQQSQARSGGPPPRSVLHGPAHSVAEYADASMLY